MRWEVIWTVMRAEMRLTRRLLRYWIFLMLAVLSGIAVYLYYCGLHSFFSSYSGTVASIGPRYLISGMGLYFLLFFVLGLVFMGFDIRARDQREGVVEVLDCRPISNAELLSGRFMAQLLMAWIPAVFMALCMEGLGFLLPALGAPIGAPLEPWSLLSFLFVMCLPALAWALALTYFITLLVRKRLPAALLSILAIGCGIWASFRLPPVSSVFFDIGGVYLATFPSDMVPGIVDFLGFLQRIGILTLALAFLALAIAIHPRLDVSRKTREWGTAVFLLIFGIGLLAVVGGMRARGLQQLHRWREAHVALADQPVPDMVRISGKVDFQPGAGMEEDLNLRLGTGVNLDSLLMTFNPGLRIVALQADGQDLDYRHEDGLLVIEKTLAAGEFLDLHLKASGKVDTDFGYLDSSRTPEELPAYQAQLFLLGYRRGINDRRCLALMPALAWLPSSGVAVDRGAAARKGRDFFDLDIEVELPEGYLPAGPGAAEDLGGDGDHHSFRFQPGAPLDQVALVVSHYIRRQATIEGVNFEILMSPAHGSNLEVLAEARAPIVEKISETIQELRKAGLDYPYSALTLVEVPNMLRGFGGGWRLPSVLAPPGMLLIREMGFPTARFDTPFRNRDKFKDLEGGVPAAKAKRVEEFFINDFSGGNLFAGVGRSMLLSQTGCSGSGEAGVEWTLESLNTLLLSGIESYFSAHLFSPKMNAVIGEAIKSFALQGGRGHFASTVIEVFNSRPEVWSSVVDTALVDMDPWENPQRSIDALSLKAGTLARAIFASLGKEKSAEVLAGLRTRFSGKTFTLDEFVGALAEESPELGSIADHLLKGRGLPGFRVQAADLYRLRDDENGVPRYQLQVTIANPEESPGVFALRYLVGDDKSPETVRGNPLPIEARSAVRFSTVLSRIPRGLRVLPYLSLNRTAFDVALPEIDSEDIHELEGVDAVETVALELPPEEGIVIDDLDEGFSIEGKDGGGGFRLTAKKTEKENLDHGLPVDEYGPMPATWSRAGAPSAWGRYRHSLAWTKKGKGLRTAVFRAEIPTSGQWQLEIHLPSKLRFRVARSWGSWTLKLQNGGQEYPLKFDAGTADAGWNVVEVLSLEAGEAQVGLSDAGSGMIVVADAIRLLPVAGKKESR